MADPRTLSWTAPALDDLDDIAAWIARDSPAAAAELVRRVLERLELLRARPRMGRHVPEAPGSRYRELVVPPCRIMYRREGAALVIVHVVRGERRPLLGRLR
ncbi:MAG: type II toxin-antitoxin system RelE/ParE family toxin [Deltaproteobacteria bacterium]|nr:type II toxin-antitoxin system RelE/ParE family toxin [Deltaproteobacteria bacterium]